MACIGREEESLRASGEDAAHLDFEAMAALLATRQEESLRHLLACPRCRRHLAAVLLEEAAFEGEDEGGAGTGIEEAATGLEGVLSRALAIEAAARGQAAQERTDALPLYHELVAAPAGQRRELVESEPRFRSRGLAEVLLGAAEEASLTDPLQSRHLASLAAAILEDLSDSAASRRLRANAYVLLADAERRRGNVGLAGDVLAAAIRELRDELLATEQRARLCRSLAAVRKEQGRIDEALALLARGREVSEEIGDDQALARACADEGWLLLEEYDPEGALALFLPAWRLAGSDRNPLATLATLHGLALAGAELGRDSEVRQVLDWIRELGGRESLDPAKISWIEAQALWRLGKREEAMALLEAVCQRLREAASPVQAAVGGLELLRWCLEAKRITVPADPLPEVATALQALHLAPPLAGAVAFVLSRLRNGPADFIFAILDSATAFLQRAQFNPELTYEPLTAGDEPAPD